MHAHSWNSAPEKQPKPRPISESGGSDGLRLSVFISCIPSCAYSLFSPPGHKDINFQQCGCQLPATNCALCPSWGCVRLASHSFWQHKAKAWSCYICVFWRGLIDYLKCVTLNLYNSKCFLFPLKWGHCVMCTLL